MSPAPFLAAASILVASVLWAIKLSFSQGTVAPDAAALLGADLVVLTVVAATGLLLVHGRWAKRLAQLLLAAQALLAVFVSLDPWWWAALAATAGGMVAIGGPWLDGWVRRLPGAAGPPPLAVALALGLLALPALVALSSPGGLGVVHWLLATAAVLVAWAYGRAMRPGIWTARFLPLIALPAALASPLPGALLLLVATVVLAWLAWTEAARLAVTPLVTVRSRPIILPHELVPPEVRAARRRRPAGERDQDPHAS
ncbi:MAG: hypothetical protein M3N51_08560 [Actinomycetota bacterium]|nr:hypothetical protein [Actinomycetota bacterium]